MNETPKRSWTGKILSFLIIAIIFSGIASILAVADIDPGSGAMATLFIAFVGAIIAIQVIPGLMLFGVMAKGLSGLFRKDEAK